MSSSPARGKRKAFAGTGLVVGLAAAVATFAVIDPSAVMAHLQRVNTWWLAPAFGLHVIQLIILGVRWSAIATLLGQRLTWTTAALEYALSVLLNQILPTGIAGDGLRALRRTTPKSSLLKVVEVLALDRASGQVGLWLILLLTLPLAPASLLNFRTVGLTVLYGLVGLGVSWVLLGRLGRWQHYGTLARQFFLRAAGVLFHPKRAFVHVPLSLLFVAVTIAQIYVAARAVGVLLSWEQMLWLGPLLLLASSAPSFFGSWGVREGAAGALFVAIGMNANTGVAVSVVYGLFALIISLPGFLVLLRDTSPARADSSDGWLKQNAFGMLVTITLSIWTGYLEVVAAYVCGSFALLLIKARHRWTPAGKFGAANMITTIRLVMTLGLLTLYRDYSGLTLAIVALTTLILDGIDGWLARKRKLSSEFGACYDVEADSVLIIALSLLLISSGRAGPWVALTACWRYIYVLAPLLFPTSVAPAKRSRFGRTIYATMISALLLALIVPLHLASPLAAFGCIIVSFSFGRSFWQRYSGPAHVN